ncbi:oxidase ustYa family protein [Aspergillus ibericus CBS 121593]|uniref:Uncharacterized protein n=1 Tax=Aspergillus ibericus CBS 121593 TaxID=1448316 RepID=A0A395GUV5_9EURO|nr:hypothetical protein BO80DRAFT_481342 [Aspergillus ibericus CBS 121593]RAK97883.1 hypothetical protein BO80DRAFT_481342 [Aspergillus ibericus CBS 121593]
MWSRQWAISDLTIASIVLSVIILLVGQSFQPPDIACVKNLSSWSPAFTAVDSSWQMFRNGFSEKSIYRGLPNPAIEEAWSDILQKHPVLVPESDTGLDMDSTDGVSLVKSSDGQIHAYLEVFRNMACLNLLRQHTYRDEYDYTSVDAFQGSEPEIMRRVDACTQRLREVLMCIGDATPYLIMLTPEKAQKESPDFNTLHYCRDFDRIVEWTRDNQIDGGGLGGHNLYI